jgi:hypothetical protein
MACSIDVPSYFCLQATDCPAGQVCCATGDDAGVLGPSCQTVPDGGACSGAGTSGSAQLCQTQGECKNGLPCILQTCQIQPGTPAHLMICGLQSQAPFNCQ